MTRTRFIAGLAAAAIGLFTAPAGADSIRYVDDDAAPLGDGLSWNTAFRFLQDALADAAATGTVTEIHVAQGVYTPDRDESNPDGYSDCCEPNGGFGCNDTACQTAVCGVLPLCCAVAWDVNCAALAYDTCSTLCADPRLTTFQLVDGVSLVGGYAGPGEAVPDAQDPELYVTVLSGDLSGDDGPGCFDNNEENVYTVVTGSGVGPTAVIDGFTITAGNANGPDPGEIEWVRGGGMCNLTGSPTVTNCRFECNSAEKLGGGMYNYNGSNPTVTDCEFTGNVTNNPNVGAGGAMCNATNCSPSVNICTFSNNYARQGGAIEFFDGSHGTVNDCTFTANDSLIAGAILAWTGSSPTITNCLFEDNLGPDNAGAVLNHTNSHPLIENCTFIGNMGHAGAMRNAENSNPTIQFCLFQENDASNVGGGMSNNASSPTVISCAFNFNTALEGGGMHNFNNSAAAISDSQFTGNSASNRGGGMVNLLNSDLVQVTNCMFSGNWAGTQSGGGVLNDGSSPTFLNCMFEDHTAANNGGGMHNRGGSDAIVQSCTFTNNLAANRGGGMSNKDSSPFVAGCDFVGNSAPAGAGMANVTGSPTVAACEFRGNTTTDLGSGGGMFNSTGSSPEVSNSLFAGNSADGNGGGIANEIDSSPAITNCTIVNNTTGLAGGGIHATDAAGGHSTPVVANCIARDNSGGQIVDESGAVTTVTYSNVEGGYAGVGNIDANPLFEDPDDGDFRLSSGSPSIDAADNSAMSGVADLDGNPRFVDDPCRADTGLGDPPIVDMGAYEFQGCSCDLDGDGSVGVNDFLLLLAAWGPCPDPCPPSCPADFNGDCEVGVGDFLELLAHWGPCPD
jgi:hypothetical protein